MEKRMVKKRILFIAHHNNDFDHFLPLIVNYKKDRNISTKILAFYTKDGILKNKLHKYICTSNSIELDSMMDICHFGKINNLLNKIHLFVLTHLKEGEKTDSRSKRIKQMTAGFIKSPLNTVLRFLHYSFLRYHVISSIFLLTQKNINKYIDSNNIDLVIIDQRTADESLIDSKPINRFIDAYTGKIDPMNLVLLRFAKTAREMKIPILMMPHGPQPISKPNIDPKNKLRIEKLKDPFRPDFLFLGSEKELSSLHHMEGIRSTFYLGDPRFDIEWINYLESCALDVYGPTVTKPADKKVLLYLMDIFTYDLANNFEYKKRMHQDILSLVNYFPDLEVWVKHHPRDVFDIPLDDFIVNDKRRSIKQFGNDTDTNILLAKADICLAASSTVLISPILQRKPVIFYDKWKEVLQNATSIYDGVSFKASSRKELITQCEKILKGEYFIDDAYLEKLYRDVFSGNYLYENMLLKYNTQIDKILETYKIN